MSEATPNDVGEDTAPSAKRSRPTEEKDDAIHCVLCFKTTEELAADDVLLLATHSCIRCNKESWRICEACEDTVLSRKCPVCRGEYAPIVMYEFPELRPNPNSQYPVLERILFQAKLSLLIKLVSGSNTAIYLPGLGVLRFLLPQDTSGGNSEISRAEIDPEPRLLQVEIPVTHDRVVDGKFVFTDRVWDELEAVQEQEDAAANNEGYDGPFVYTAVDLTVETIPERLLAFIGKTFVDRETGLSHRVVNIARTESFPGVLFFEYHESRLPDETHAGDSEHSSCEEMLCVDSWAVWDHNPRLDDEDWVQCSVCNKWRRLPQRGSEFYPSDLPSTWTCAMSTWDPAKASCEADEDAYDDTVPVVLDGVPIQNSESQSDATENQPFEDTVAQSAAPAVPSTATTTTTTAESAGWDNNNSFGLQVAIRRITEVLQTHPGARLFTRLTPETMADILRGAAETGLRDGGAR